MTNLIMFRDIATKKWWRCWNVSLNTIIKSKPARVDGYLYHCPNSKIEETFEIIQLDPHANEFFIPDKGVQEYLEKENETWVTS